MRHQPSLPVTPEMLDQLAFEGVTVSAKPITEGWERFDELEAAIQSEIAQDGGYNPDFWVENDKLPREWSYVYSKVPVVALPSWRLRAQSVAGWYAREMTELSYDLLQSIHVAAKDAEQQVFRRLGKSALHCSGRDDLVQSNATARINAIPIGSTGILWHTDHQEPKEADKHGELSRAVGANVLVNLSHQTRHLQVLPRGWAVDVQTNKPKPVSLLLEGVRVTVPARHIYMVAAGANLHDEDDPWPMSYPDHQVEFDKPLTEPALSLGIFANAITHPGASQLDKFRRNGERVASSGWSAAHHLVREVVRRS